MAKILIVGAGIVGLSVARAARQRGHEVTILEQGPVPNPQSASFDNHRMIRYPYAAAAGYTRMVTEAFAAWERLWRDIGTVHFENTGAIAVSLEPGDYADKTRETFRKIGLPHDVHDRAGIEKICPHLSLPKGAWAVSASPGGPLFASRIVTDLVKWLLAHGVTIEANTRVTRVDEQAGTAWVEDGSGHTGDLLLIAAGAWLPHLLPDTFGDLHVYRQALLYVDPPPQYEESWRKAPAIVVIGQHGGYTLPDLQGAGLKFGYSPHRRRILPGDGGFDSDFPSESKHIFDAFRPYLHNADGYQPQRMQVGYYILDPSRRFRFEKNGRALVVTNCDGQMFKFGPLVGERIIGMFDGQETMESLAHWAAGH